MSSTSPAIPPTVEFASALVRDNHREIDDRGGELVEPPIGERVSAVDSLTA